MSVILVPKRSVRRLSTEDAKDIGVDAYTYLYPLVLMNVARRVCINHPLGAKPGFGPEGMFHHVREFPDDTTRQSIRANFDMLCSFAWLDLSKGPHAISVPVTEGHYYAMALYDMWTDAFATIGTRTIGSDARCFAIVPPGWNGELQDGLERIQAPTTRIWINLQIQTKGPKNYPAIHELQNGFTVRPLSETKRLLPATQKIDPAVDIYTSPRDQVQAMAAGGFFKLAADFMKTDVSHATDWSILARMRRIGLEPGKAFHIKKAPAAVQSELDESAREAHRRMARKISAVTPVVNGWHLDTCSIGVYGNDYLKRAAVASVNLGALPSADAIFPTTVATTNGSVLTGRNSYVLHFRKEELPPVHGFWSISMYDGDGYPARNPLNRFIIRDYSPLNYNLDGSLDIYIQKDQPAGDMIPNWLPSPEGPLMIMLRLYSPRAVVFDGGWAPPLVQRADNEAAESKPLYAVPKIEISDANVATTH
jgi:hypothetical protein